MLSGFGGGMSRQTEGINMSRPPGPVTSHLLRCELSFRMPSFPFKIPFCCSKQNMDTSRGNTELYYTIVFHLIFYVSVFVCMCLWESIYPTWSCLKSHKAWTMTGLVVFSSGLRGFSLTMDLDLLTRLWTCLLFSRICSLSFCEHPKIKIIKIWVLNCVTVHWHCTLSF